MYRCGACWGKSPEEKHACKVCGGWEYLPGFAGTCPSCRGTGHTGPTPCALCQGKGIITQAQRFQNPTILVIPVSLLKQQLLALWAGEPLPNDTLAGLAAGILTGIAANTSDASLPPGLQLTEILQQGGSLLIAPDGIWHVLDTMPPARIIAYPVAKE